MPCPLTKRVIVLAAFLLLTGSVSAAEQPNVLWLTAEDHGPHVGAYGDPYASTPVIDKLAARGMLYRHAWSTAPVCAPARTTLISGLYPPSTGSQHMRSMTRLPASMKMYPQYLCEAGYYVTNNAKEDYNLEKPGQVWDESSQKAHWRNRKPGQPFFAIFNFTQSHESQIRTRPHKQVHDPARVRIPAYHPDTPEVRQDWAQYYDKISEVDALAGQVLSQLEEDGLAADTIVFYYSDHGSGMPRNKRWTYNSGLQVPVIVYFPEKWRHLAPAEYKPGGESKRLIGFIDFAPTLLSICGLAPPAHMQGRAFAGAHAQPGPRYQFAFRDRMDERIDMSRAVREERYVYIRNFQPHRVYGQHLAYMFETPTTRVWKALFDQGKLNLAQQAFWQEKPPEELYDIEADPDEVRNLARDKAHSSRLQRLRGALREWQINIRDLGLLPEGEIHSRAGAGSPYEMGQDQKRFPVRRILRMAEDASSLESGPAVEQLRKSFTDADSAVRYWAAMGALIRKGRGVTALRRELNEALQDDSPFVRIVAAETLGRYGGAAEAEKALEVLLQLAPADKNGLHISVAALNAIYYLGPKAAGAKNRIESLPQKSDDIPARLGDYVPRLIADILADL